MYRLKKLREQEGLTLEEMANKINSESTVLNQYEQGACEPNILELMRLSDFFDVTIDYLVGRDAGDGSFDAYQYYVFYNDFALKKVGASVLSPESGTPILNKNELETLECVLELNSRLSEFLASLYKRWHLEQISDDSYEKLARVLVNEESFYVAVIDNVDSK